MALKILNPGTAAPLGQFDVLDTDLTTVLGGEVATFTAVTYAGSDKAAADVADGYTGTTSKTRPAATVVLGTGANGPYFLTDDGTTNYGTLFGSIVGGAVGTSTTGSNLGPHTSTGSGKVTLWGAQGLYGVTLDACDTTLAPATPIAVGAALTASATTGKLGTGLTANAGATMARFVEFATDGSLVKTPNTLASAINSPGSDIPGALPRAFTMAVFYWLGK